MAELKRCLVLTENERECISDTFRLCDQISNEYGKYSLKDILLILSEVTSYDGGMFTVPEIIDL